MSTSNGKSKSDIFFEHFATTKITQHIAHEPIVRGYAKSVCFAVRYGARGEEQRDVHFSVCSLRRENANGVLIGKQRVEHIRAHIAEHIAPLVSRLLRHDETERHNEKHAVVLCGASASDMRAVVTLAAKDETKSNAFAPLFEYSRN